MKKTVVQKDENFDREYPKKWSTEVTLDDVNGNSFVSLINNPLGDPENPVSSFYYNTTDDALGIYFDSNYVFVAGNNAFLQLTSILTEVSVDPGDDEEPDIPISFVLDQNFPNPFSPFNPETYIRFSLNNPAHVKLTIYN